MSIGEHPSPSPVTVHSNRSDSTKKSNEILKSEVNRLASLIEENTAKLNTKVCHVIIIADHQS